MRVFSLNNSGVNDAYVLDVWRAIQENMGYFKKFNGANYEEAAHAALVRATSNRRDEYTELAPYIKKLARTELRQRQKDVPYSPTDEESGELARPFLKLAEGFDIVENSHVDKLKATFRDLYLLYPDEIMALEPLLLNAEFTQQEAQQLKAQSNVLLNDRVRGIINKVIEPIDGRVAFQAIIDFYKEMRGGAPVVEEVKSVKLVPADYRCKVRIPTGNTIRITSAKQTKYINTEVGIDCSRRIKMTSDINLDYVKWEPLTKGKCELMKICIAPLINYIYDEIFAEKGINTNLRRWAGTHYVLTTLGGQEHLNMDENMFIDLCFEEVLLNFVSNNINNVIGFTADNIYIKPVRKITYNRLRCTDFTGKSFDLEVTPVTK